MSASKVCSGACLIRIRTFCARSPVETFSIVYGSHIHGGDYTFPMGERFIRMQLRFNASVRSRIQMYDG